MRKEKGIPTHKAAILLAVAVLITAGITALVYSSYKILNYEEFEVKLQVSDKQRIGFNLDPGVFNFGKVPQGSVAKRNATVSQNYPQDVVVRIEIEGIKDLVSVSQNYFILPTNITREIEIIARIPENKSAGNYSGKLKVYYLRP